MEKDYIKKIQQTKGLIKIFNLNISLLKSLLSEIEEHLFEIQNKISRDNLITIKELEKLKKQENIFKLYVNDKKSALLEFENQLKLAQDRLKSLQQ